MFAANTWRLSKQSRYWVSNAMRSFLALLNSIWMALPCSIDARQANEWSNSIWFQSMGSSLTKGMLIWWMFINSDSPDSLFCLESCWKLMKHSEMKSLALVNPIAMQSERALLKSLVLQISNISSISLLLCFISVNIVLWELKSSGEKCCLFSMYTKWAHSWDSCGSLAEICVWTLLRELRKRITSNRSKLGYLDLPQNIANLHLINNLHPAQTLLDDFFNLISQHLHTVHSKMFNATQKDLIARRKILRIFQRYRICLGRGIAIRCLIMIMIHTARDYCQLNAQKSLKIWHHIDLSNQISKNIILELFVINQTFFRWLLDTKKNKLKEIEGSNWNLPYFDIF